MDFKLWLENDIFGFNNNREEPPKPPDDLPIQAFALDKLMDYIAESQIGEYIINRPFADQVQWGTDDGAIRARLTPNQGINIERMSTDLQGKPFWVTKRIVKMKTNEYAGRETVVASEVVDLIGKISNEQTDSATANYRGLHGLTNQIALNIKNKIPLFIYEEIKKINENNYNILMTVVGGVGKVVHRIRGPAYTSAGIIDMSYDPNRGTIKSILTTVDIENEGGAWTIDVPYFMGEFAPSQPMEEITNNIVAGLKFI